MTGLKRQKNIMLYVRQQRRNEVQYLLLVISDRIFWPRTMNFAIGTFLCNFLDFRQFTVDSSKTNKENS